jgi:hypothetical protein
MKTKEQFNTRVKSELKHAVCVVAAATNTTIEELTEAALATFLGSTSKELDARRTTAQTAVKRLRLRFNGGESSFAA